MIRCPHCNTEAAPGSRFCPGCGKSLYVPCPNCNQEVGAWMAFCPHCGSRLSGVEQATSDSDVRLATVLFGDVKGFTAMSEHLPPEEVTNIMNQCFEMLSEPIVRYGGTIDKYVGDAIMARFGAPQAHEDDPVRAIHAALEMQEALARFAQELEATRGFQLAMRIGINTGQVLAGQVGSAALKQFTLMGNTVNLASRLEHEAEPGRVLVGEATYRLAKHAFEFQAMPPMEIRGQSELINAFVPLRPRSGPVSRAGRSDRKLTLIGRESELGLLDGWLQEARAGEGRLVAIVADPGIGKSRLADELWKRHDAEGIMHVYASAPSFGESMPYSLLRSFIHSLLLGGMEDHEIHAEDLRDRLITLLPERSVNDAVALLGDLLGVAMDGTTDVAGMEARSRQAMLTNVLKMLLAARSYQGPVLLVLEDLHWIDSASLDVFDQILTSIQSMRVMAVLTHRPQFTHRWSSMAFYRQVNLRELTEEDARGLLRDFFGSSQIPLTVGRRVMEKAGGNPFFLEQLLNSLIDAGAVVQRDGRWVLAGDVETLQVPDTIQEILLARIDQLPRETRTVLEIGAVIGRVFAYRLLVAIAGDGKSVDEQLQLLQRQEFVYESAVLPDLQYTFRHSLTHDVVYNGMLESRRRTLHELVATAIESLGLAADGEQAPLLAVHYEKTANRDKALEYAMAAAERSRQLYANHDAVVYYRQALDLLGDDQLHRTERLAVLEALGDVHELAAEFDEAHEQYTRALEECDDRLDRARLHRKLGELAEMRGHYAEAMTSYRQAEDQLAELDAPGEQVNIWLALARMDRSRGALESAAATCLRALSLANRVDDTTSASLYFELGEVEREQGHLRSASGYLMAAESVWEGVGALEKQALVAAALADVSFTRGELAEAQEHFEKALEIHHRVLDRQGIAVALYGIARARLAMGDVEGARERLTDALAIATEIEYQALAANCQLQLGIIHLESGDIEAAEELIEQAYRGFKSMRNWRGTANALVARARLLWARRQLDRARSALRRAGNLGEEMNDPWVQGQVRVSEAELEEGAGDLDLAADHATAAISLGRNLADGRLVARAERILGRVRARQGQRREALVLLENSAGALRRMGAQMDGARAALDYVVAAQGLQGEKSDTADEMLDFARVTFAERGSPRDRLMLDAVAQRYRAASSA